MSSVSYTAVANTSYGPVASDNTGALLVNNGTDWSKAKCDEDPSCVAYGTNAANTSNYALDEMNTLSTPSTPLTGFTTNVKNYSNCKAVQSSKYSTPAYYLDGHCVINTDPVNKDTKHNLLKKLESNSPKTLVVSKSKRGKLLYVMYIPSMPATGTDLLPYSPFTMVWGSTITYEKSYFHGQIIYMYYIITITEEADYRISTEDASFAASLKYYINGVPVDDYLVRLMPGDYLLCVEFDSSKASKPLDGLKITKGFTSNNLIYSLVVKNINFYTQVGDKYTETINNVCTPDTYLTSEYCKGLLKNDITANDLVKNKCLTNVNGELLYTGGELCSNVIDAVLDKTGEVNQSLATDLYNSVVKWFTSKISSSSTLSGMTSEEIAKLNSMLDKIKKYSNTVPGIDKSSVRTEIAKYCTDSSGDVFSVPNDSSICGKIYNDESLVNYNNILLSSDKTLASEINQSKEKLKYNYCTKKDASGVLRYENDKSCQEEIINNKFLNTDIEKRCIDNGAWVGDAFCDGLTEKIMSSEINKGTAVLNQDLTKSLKEAKNRQILFEFTDSNLIKNKGKTKYEDYVINYYAKHPNYSVNELLNKDFINYCQQNDSNLVKETSCSPLYKAFNKEPKIVNSKARMRQRNCMSEDRIITNMSTQESKDKNENECFNLVNGNLHNQYTFKDAINNFCAKPENITKPECNQYYQTAGDKFIKNLTNNTAPSSFINKEGFDNGAVDNGAVDDGAVDEIAKEIPGAVNYGFIIYILLFVVTVCTIVFLLLKNKKTVKRNNVFIDNIKKSS